MLSPIFDFGQNWVVFPNFVSRHSNVSMSSRSDSRAYLNLPQSHIKAQTYFTSLSSSFTINLFAKNCQMLTHFLNHVIHGDTSTPSFQGDTPISFFKIVKIWKSFCVKMISHSWGYSNPILLRGYSNPILLRGYSNPIFQLQINHSFFFPDFHEFVKQTLFNQETQMHLENYWFGYS